MRLPMMARSRVSTLAVLALVGLVLTGCADATAPKAAPWSELSTSPFKPGDAQMALVGVSDGTYSFTIDPTHDQTLQFGASGLYLPANSICDLSSSSYGVSFWNDSCSVERSSVTITAVVRDAATDHPSVDFQPAMRFNPSKSVWLYLSVSNQATLDASRLVKYCNATGCVDESVTDASLKSYVDTKNKVVFRRIKHFSGYLVSTFAQVDDLVESLF